MPKITVTYFNLKGMGQGIRMLLAYGDQEFEDKRVALEEWAELKWKTPFGVLPVVEIDEKEYSQTLAICRFLGRKYGLAGDNSEEDLIIDQNIDFFNDVRLNVAAAFYDPDEKVKASKYENLVKNHLPYLLPRMDKILKENDGHIALGKLTWADFVFAGFYDTMKFTMHMSDLDEKYPSFKQLKDKVTALPKVKEYCDAAPKAIY